MKIRLGLHLDGQRGWHPGNRLGDTTLGPLGFLNILETQLGLLRDIASQSERIVQYRDCLKRSDNPDRFYHRTFATDELGTAATLLGWRDAWHLNGWSGDLSTARARRLRDMGVVEALAAKSVDMSVGERLLSVRNAMAKRKVRVEGVQLLNPLEEFPVRWRNVLSALPGLSVEETADPVTGNTFLSNLQLALVKVQAGQKISTKLPWKADDSLTVVQGETRFLSGRWLAERVGDKSGDALIVATADGPIFDSILVAADVARHGFGESSAFRPALQVLPLALEIIWEPLNFYGLLQFLTHPVCPVPGYAARRLAAKLADKPGIGGESWASVLGEIDIRDEERAKEVREIIKFWVEHDRYPEDSGAPVSAVLARVNRLAEYFRDRLADPDRASRIAFNAGFGQCKACGAALDGLLKQGEVTIRLRQLQRLVIQATARGSENPLLEPEVGALMAITDPSAAVEPCDRVIWWQLGMPSLPENYPWSAAEIDELANHGVILPKMSAVLDQTAKGWLKPILAAKKELVLVLPPKGQEAHPVWLMIEALTSGIPVTPLEGMLATASDGHPEVPHSPLPPLQRWWQLPPGLEIPKKGRDSFSALQVLLFNPYQWLLKYPAALKPSRILSVSDDFLLFGNLSHSLVEKFFTEHGTKAISPVDFQHWFKATFDQLIREEGAVLLMPGRRSELENFRLKVANSMQQLQGYLQAAAITHIEPERELTGSYAGGELVGFADLVVKNQSGQKAIVDMKWAGDKKYAGMLEKNEQLQLAIYAELLYQQESAWPAVAYYILQSGRLLAIDDAFFPTAKTVHRKTTENNAELWQRFLATWTWRQAQFKDGRFEVVLDTIDPDDKSTPPETGLPIETLPPLYNDYLALAGWEDRA